MYKQETQCGVTITMTYEVVVVKKINTHETVAVNLSKIYFLKNAKKTCKSDNRDLNRNGIIT